MDLNVAVIGAGVMGISTAYQLLTQFPNINVHVISKDFTPNTTSDAAAGYWRIPDVKLNERARTIKWGVETKDYIVNLVKNEPDSNKMGVSLVHGYLLSQRDRTPYWKEHALNFRILTPEELKKQFAVDFKWACAYTAPVVQGNKYLPYMSEKILKNGGKFINQKVNDFKALYDKYDVIINCTGVGAKQIANDQSVHPVRGHVIRVKAPWVNEFIYDIDLDEKNRVRHLLPNQDYVVIGGLKHENDFSTVPLVEDKNWLLQEAQKLCPSIKNGEIVGEKVAFRPGRPSIRLEKEMVHRVRPNQKTKLIIHNYGHSSNGWSLFWGCSNEVVNIFKEYLSNSAYSAKL